MALHPQKCKKCGLRIDARDRAGLNRETCATCSLKSDVSSPLRKCARCGEEYREGYGVQRDECPDCTEKRAMVASRPGGRDCYEYTRTSWGFRLVRGFSLLRRQDREC